MTGYDDNLWANARSPERKRAARKAELHQSVAGLHQAFAGLRRSLVETAAEAFRMFGGSPRSTQKAARPPSSP